MATHFTILHIFLLSITWGGDFAQSIRKELRTTETSQDKYLRLGNPVQRKIVDPSRAVQLSWQPRVLLYRDFLSGEECDYLISWVRRKRSFTGFGNDSINFGISMDSDGEPFIDGKVVPYDEKYHADWLRDNYGEGYTERNCSRRRRRRKRGSRNFHATHD
ncbi:hypothetical protein CASFOL_005419 [Castilleja foliolosa]|uniref:Uncharacterized protein n=1 Tax=Castilleja foliolosa TaxID=1961234 RepID=A0ABD3E7H3_9LAMI